MPTYEYVCDSCGHQFEQFQSIKDKPLRKCPKCGKLKLNRLIGAGAGVIFKGAGFYATDYRSKSYKEAEKKEKDPGEKKSEGKKADAGDSKSSGQDKGGAKNEKKSTSK
jgi:putative FmdB family regulatory protein